MVVTDWTDIKERIPTLFNAPAVFENLDELKVVFGYQNFTSYRGGTWNSYNSLWASRDKENYGKCVELNSDSRDGRYCGYVINSYFDFNDDYVDGRIQIETIGISNKDRSDAQYPLLWYAYDDSQNSRADILNYFNDGEDIFTTASGDTQAFNMTYTHAFTDYLFIDSNLPIFDTEAHARAYINTGSTVGCLNLDESVIDNYPQEYYFEEIIYRYDKALKNKQVIKNVKNYYICDKKVIKICGYVNDNAPYNIRFKAKTSDSTVNKIECYHVKGGTALAKPTIAVFNLLQDEWNNIGIYGQTSDSTYIYRGSPHTNIPIYKSETDADKYLDNTEDVQPIKPTVPVNPPVDDGDNADTQDTDITNNTFAEPFLSNQYILTYSQMEQVANLIYTTNLDTLDNLVKAFKFYGENPIADIVDVVHMPIKVDDFINTESSHLKFASYVSDITGRKITAHGKLKTLGSMTISPLFNDYRDYTNVSLMLYLPFCSIMPLDVNLFMNSTITIKCTMDTRSHNIRYYIFCNNGNNTSLVQFIDCAVGKSIILMGNDVANKLKNTISSIQGLSHMARSQNISAGSNVANVLTSAVVNPVGAIPTALQGTFNQAQQQEDIKYAMQSATLEFTQTQPIKTFSGSQSSGCAENDILYPYLIYSIQGSVLPVGLRDTYGAPCNVVGKLSNFTGFTMCDNLRLHTTATEDEINEIYTLAQGGIII